MLSLFVVLQIVFINITSVGGTSSSIRNFDSALIRVNAVFQIQRQKEQKRSFIRLGRKIETIL